MNRIAHFEFHCPDVAVARQFYADVFEWEFQKWDGPAEYWLTKTGTEGEGINGGLLTSRDGQPRVVNVITVADVDAAAAKVIASGGQVVVEKMPIPGVGYVAYCTDPGGLLFGIYHDDPTAR